MKALSLDRARLRLLSLAVIGLAGLALLTGCTPEVNAELRTYAGVNQIRTERGLSGLQADARLVEVARIRSRDMASKGYFSHNPPDGCNYICIMDSRGVPHAYAGENIAWNTWDWSQTADVAVQMWKNSPPHMQNILNCHYERFGSGVAKAPDGKIYFTLVFEGNRAC